MPSSNSRRTGRNGYEPPLNEYADRKAPTPKKLVTCPACFVKRNVFTHKDCPRCNPSSLPI